MSRLPRRPNPRPAALLPLLFAAASAQADDGALRADCDAPAFQRVLHAAKATPSDARALWLDRQTLRWPGRPADGRYVLHHSAEARLDVAASEPVRGSDGRIELAAFAGGLAPETAQRFAWAGDGATFALPAAAVARLPDLLRRQLLLVREDAEGRVLDATAVQHPGALDDLYAPAESVSDLGVTASAAATGFALWAPTAQHVAVCVYPRGDSDRALALPARRDDATGVWRAKLHSDRRGGYYAWLVDVVVPGVGVVRNRVTDPYSLSLTTDSKRSWIGALDDPATKPAGWDAAPRPAPLASATDMVIYELHVRDFSIGDTSVPEAHRGKYLAFAEPASSGVTHLRALADAGLTDIHLLPVFDIATVPEHGCVAPRPEGAPDGEAQQAAIAADKHRDCFNWGYDPYHFTAPEGGYASDPADGAVRVRELRAMVQALHAMGLRVGMDVVYNHTTTAGQDETSVLDRIVPGYYHRLDRDGRVTRSTCCENTATEHAMMAKLMIDSAVVWARDYRIDSFRFDLMGHQPRAAMERLQLAVNAAAGREVQLIGEGWNFGEVADGARFVQASQLSLQGTGIATFSDRARDAARGGGAGDDGVVQVEKQGWLNGLGYAPNAHAPRDTDAADLMRAADLVRVGLAGTLRDYPMPTFDGAAKPLAAIDYANQPAGYAASPAEVVNYVENHDNQTLYDLNAFKLPLATPAAERARVQILGAAIVAFSQGVAYYHAGIDTLRSKSMDRNSFDSGDWFNPLDWTYRDNGFGRGLPPADDNAASWDWMRPRLADPALKPSPADIAWTRDAFRDLLRIRASSSLFRLRTGDEVKARLRLPNTGPDQVPTVLLGHLDGDGYPGAGFREVLYALNADTQPRTLVLSSERGKAYVLHPVHRAAAAADRRPLEEAVFDAGTGRLTVPARTAVVYVIE